MSSSTQKQKEKKIIDRLDKVLARFQARGIVLSPLKCSFGMPEVEILGHTINEDGSHFSRNKLDTILEFKLPATGSQMHSFVALCDYYRQHVERINELERPLRKLMQTYPGTKKIPWDQHPGDEKAFYQLRQAVGECPRLFFYDSHMPVFVHTDACNGGIGGYVFQRDEDGKEYPIGFLSKSLRGAELDWSTFEQECFAIQQTLKKFSYLLSDVKFTIRTDHRNLLYMNNDASSKVLRWKWDIQDFDFDIEHISGATNIAADLFSRLCVLQTTDEIVSSVEQHESTLKEFSKPSYLFALAATRKVGPLKPWMKDNRPIQEDVYKLIQSVHGWGCQNDDGTVTEGTHGHQGVEKTLCLLKDKLLPSKWWYTMRQDVKQFINECPNCQFMQAAKLAITKRAQIQPYNMATGQPMDRINIDTIGPFNEDDDGNKYIMVFIDVFSRFIELFAVRDLTAATAAKRVMEFTGRYGIPSQILTDNGTQYINELANQIYDCMWTNHISIMPYSHEENSIVERANKEINRHLRAIVFDRKIKSKWSMALPLIQRVMNTTVHSSIGTSPSQIIFGNAIDLDRRILHEPFAHNATERTYSEYVMNLLNVQAEIIAKAQATQEAVTEQHIARQLRERRQAPEIKQDDYVLWEYPENGLARDSRPDRLTPHYRGPYRVIKTTPRSIQIQNLVTEELHEVISPSLKKFNFDPTIINPENVARQAQQEFLPDSILQIDGNRNPRNRRYLRTNLIVLVHWAGYSSQFDSWEPYKELKHTDAFKTFCNNNHLQYLLD